MEPINPHLAFEPAALDPDAEVSIPEFIGITEKDRDRLNDLLQKCIDDADTHSETLSLISKRVATPQELMLLGFSYMSFIATSSKKAALAESLAKAMLGL